MPVKRLCSDVRKAISDVLSGAVRIDDGSRAPLDALQTVYDDQAFWSRTSLEPVFVPKLICFRSFPGYGHLPKWINFWAYYIFQNAAYVVLGGAYTEEEKKLLIQEEFDLDRRKFERLHHKFAVAHHTESRYERPTIPEEVRIAVWRRDGGKCARCGSRESLEYDHIIPVSRGGSNTARNIELLCESCNRSKGNAIQ
jgi:hypothetical protein